MSNKKEIAWKNAPHCECGEYDCNPNNHKICYLCHEIMLKCAHQDKQPKSKFSWNIDHINPKAIGGTSKNSNIIAVHVSCNSNKGNHYY